MLSTPGLERKAEARPKTNADDRAERCACNPQPAVQARRRDTAEERADVAAERQSGAVSHEQAAGNRRGD